MTNLIQPAQARITADHPPISVAVCDSYAHLAPLFDALCGALDGRGSHYERFPSYHALLEDRSRLPEVDVIAAFGSIPVTEAVIRAAPRLRAVVSCVAGTDGIDLAAATAAGVLVANASTDENSRCMAESVLMLLLQLFYDLDGTRDDLRHGRDRPQPLRARMLSGKTIGIVGWGRIARTLADLLAPWRVRLLVYSRRGTPPDLAAHATPVDLDGLMAASDAVCVLAAPEPGGPPLVGAPQLSRMKPDAFFVNVSRGATVDEAALVETLRAGRIAGAALDVFRVEPLPADSPLRALPNVILTPHHVGHTREADESLIPAIIDNVIAPLEGRLPSRVRNPAVAALWRDRWGGRPILPS